MDLHIIPECYVDTNLIETLVSPLKGYNHQKGCGTVTKVMKERFSDDFALGIIDKDKKEIDYLKEFTEVLAKGSLILHKHKSRPHYIIQINPAIEQFILNAVNEVGLHLREYDLPDSIDALKKVSKSANSKNDQRFKRLFRDVRKIGGNELNILASWVEYLKSTTYDAELEVIKSL
ncbi:hypothetical protein [Sphingobacterium chuzhouense]|uniref:DUF3800 domain-containing protein n=1 Tax=Sphingobacterium chuzhouense TaxID=1742264 RepID=A0ABR7XPA6_9SPHI|nr:hypothetical protein [Sphingobacterium chuzhouense]MBD1421004.1 hypothetical protein [Sphingobacterium chuzhouense]